MTVQKQLDIARNTLEELTDIVSQLNLTTRDILVSNVDIRQRLTKLEKEDNHAL